jgi:hypothetical protein
LRSGDRIAGQHGETPPLGVCCPGGDMAVLPVCVVSIRADGLTLVPSTTFLMLSPCGRLHGRAHLALHHAIPGVARGLVIRLSQCSYWDARLPLSKVERTDWHAQAFPRLAGECSFPASACCNQDRGPTLFRSPASGETEMPASVRRFLIYYGIYRRYPLGRLPAPRNAWRITRDASTAPLRP